MKIFEDQFLFFYSISHNDGNVSCAMISFRAVHPVLDARVDPVLSPVCQPPVSTFENKYEN